MTTAIDVMSAADILAGLPAGIDEVIVRHVAERPSHPAFVEGDRAWSYREFAQNRGVAIPSGLAWEMPETAQAASGMEAARSSTRLLYGT